MEEKKSSKAGQVIITILLVLCAGVLVLNLSLKSVITRSISEQGINSVISHRMTDVISDTTGEYDPYLWTDIQNYIEDNKMIDAITGDLLDGMIENFEKEGYKFEEIDFTENLEKLYEDTISYIKTSHPEIPQDVFDKMEAGFEKQKSKLDSTVNSYAKGVYYYAGTSSAVVSMIHFYGVMVSGKLRAGMIAAIVLLTILLIVITRPKQKTLIYLSTGLVITSVMTYLSAFVGNKMMSYISNHYIGRTIFLHVKDIYTTAGIILAVGIGLAVLYAVMKPKKIK